MCQMVRRKSIDSLIRSDTEYRQLKRGGPNLSIGEREGGAEKEKVTERAKKTSESERERESKRWRRMKRGTVKMREKERTKMT